MNRIFFVLNGLLNGERGVRATTCGFGEQLKDGWYFLADDDDDDGQGPYVSKNDAYNAAIEHDRVNDQIKMGVK